MGDLPKLNTYASEQFIEEVMEAIFEYQPELTTSISSLGMVRQMAEAVAERLTKFGHHYLFTDCGEIRKVQETEFNEGYDHCDSFTVWVDKGEDDE